MTTLTAYHGLNVEKNDVIAQLAAHRKADEIVQGIYWENGKGCAVGCLTHQPGGGHFMFPERFGIPTQLAYVIDDLFEALPADKAKDWPERIMGAIPVGADLGRVWDQYQAWVLEDLDEIAGVNKGVVAKMAALFRRAGEGDEPSAGEWNEAGTEAREARAAWEAWEAREAWAAWAAREAWEAWEAREAWAAWAAWAARAAWEAWEARAAWEAWEARAAWAARAARAAWEARASWSDRACAELIRLVKNAPITTTV